MTIERPPISAAVFLLFSGVLGGCNPKTDGLYAASGGAGGSGGSSDSGGTSGNGGTSGSGGASASGGATGTTTSGGSTATGGSSATGGTNASGGALASGGSAGSSGTGGGGGAFVTGGSSGSGGLAGSSGKSNSGGESGISGAGGSGGGGLAASGGTNASGGIIGSGGTAGTGGTITTGGTVGSGGTSASGGIIGSGGTAGSSGPPVTGGNSGAVDCTDTSTTSLSFTKQYENGTIAVAGSTKTYYTMTNWWHKFSGQTVKLDGLSMTLGNSQDAAVPSSDGNPMGFPTIFIGSYQNHTTVGSNLPMQVSAIKSVPTTFSTNASTLDTSNFNATYDVWFTATNAKLGAMASSPGKGGAYLMVWLYKPSDRQPRGGAVSTTGASPNHSGQTVAGVPGTWDVWVDNSTDPPCISYVSSKPLDSLSYDLNNFIQDSVNNKYGVTSSMYLGLVFAGFEVWSGGDGLQAKQFCAAVN